MIDRHSPHALRPVHRLKILVVDDEPDTVLSTTLMIEFWGHVAYPAASGAEALDKLAQNEPDVVLLDLAMPGYSGFDLAKNIRQQELFKRPFLIALSGLADPIYRRRAVEVGIDVAFAKPVDCNLLRSMLERFGDLAYPPDPQGPVPETPPTNVGGSLQGM
ncbi:MAG TPA: response regulator [Gemmataceae bacterium]|jgi:CheY-like chemotaxis protein|nr:response regulator [Gemmataceae bacterium]